MPMKLTHHQNNLTYPKIINQGIKPIYTLCQIKRLYLGKVFNNAYLTKREIDILTYVTLGHTSKRIAQRLNLSYRTVETHIDSLKTKLHCSYKESIPEVVIKYGIIQYLSLLDTGV
jgi:DNA-binding NarL/FixJ family response regulator